MKKKYGLKLNKKKDPRAYKFGGGNVPMEYLTDGDWSPYLPVKEIQNLNGIEPYACVPFTILNCLEILVKRLYGEDRNWSDRFLAYVTDTRNGGSDPHECAEFLRKLGVPPEEYWPFDGKINTTEKFFAKPEPKIYEIAREFLEEFDFRHEYVSNKHEAISEALKCSPLLISVYAWHRNSDIYYKPSGKKDNHATTMFQESVGRHRRVFDSYDSPHIKDYDWNARPEVVKRFWIQKKPIYQEKLSIIEKVLNLIAKMFGLVKPAEPIDKAKLFPHEVSRAEPETAPKYLWDTPTLARHSVRVICDEEGLTLAEKDLITAVIRAESGFRTDIVVQNTDRRRSEDYGICQYNSYWYVERMKLITKDQALNDPEFCVRLMIKRYRQGFLKDWVAYSSGAYKKYL